MKNVNSMPILTITTCQQQMSFQSMAGSSSTSLDAAAVYDAYLQNFLPSAVPTPSMTETPVPTRAPVSMTIADAADTDTAPLP
jgi:hypothetical protein